MVWVFLPWTVDLIIPHTQRILRLTFSLTPRLINEHIAMNLLCGGSLGH